MHYPTLHGYLSTSDQIDSVFEDEVILTVLEQWLLQFYQKELDREVDSKMLNQQDKQQDQQEKIQLDEEVLMQNYKELRELDIAAQDKMSLFKNINKISNMLQNKIQHNNKYINGLIDEITENTRNKVKENNEFEFQINMSL